MPKPSKSKWITEVSEKGFVFLPAYFPRVDTGEIITRFGLVEKLEGLDNIQTLSPKATANAPPNIYSGNFGYDEFPFHTDLAHWYLPPRFILLRCIKGTTDVKTRLIDSSSLVESLGRQNLQRTLVQPRRAIQGNRCLLRILEQCPGDDTSRFRWDSLFIEPSTTQSTRMCLAIKEKLSNMKPIDFVLKQPGDTLIVDNWRVLHARSAVPVNQRFRKIHRAYMSALL